MAGKPNSFSPIFYEIEVAGRLSPEWSAWFEGMEITSRHATQEKTVTTLRASIADQSALFGTLARIRDLGLTLISINCVETEQMEEEA